MAKKELFIYEVEGKRYVQKKLVLGQIAQLMDLLKETTIPAMFSLADDAGDMKLSFNAGAVAALLGERLPRAVAIVLTEEKVPLPEKDLERLTGEVRWAFDSEITMRVVEDFFTCNPIVSLLERYVGMMKNMRESIARSGSKTSAFFSPGETSRSARGSSGDTRPPSAGLT